MLMDGIDMLLPPCRSPIVCGSWRLRGAGVERPAGSEPEQRLTGPIIRLGRHLRDPAISVDLARKTCTLVVGKSIDTIEYYTVQLLFLVLLNCKFIDYTGDRNGFQIVPLDVLVIGMEVHLLSLTTFTPLSTNPQTSLSYFLSY
jgi:hypothetical protein